MTQQIINIGAAPNDGEGDNLRTAFDKVNDNFSNVWAQGPVDSNVRIQGNTISTLQVNQDLALSPNGAGNIRLNNNTIPGANNTWFLGSTTNRWRGLYVGNVTANNLSVSGIVDLSGDVTVGGNLTVVGNTIQIGNIVTDTKTIQLSNTAASAAAANGSGITVGANDNIATMLYSSTSNVWAMNIGANLAGNVTANYFFGNGSQLTGLPVQYGNANVVTLLAGFGSNTISTTGNISGGYFFGNVSQATGFPATYGNANAVAYGESGWAGNIVPSGNAVYSLGNATNQWNDLYVSNATIFMNNVPISLSAGNVLTVNGNAVLSNNSNTAVSTTGNITAGNVLTGGTVSATGNITANYFVGNGSQLTGLNVTTSNISNGTSNVDIPVANGNVIINTAGTYAWTFDDTGNLTIPNDIVSNTTIDIDNRASGNSADIQLFAADDITLQARDRSAGSTSEGGDINIFAGDSAEDGDSTGGDVNIRAGAGGAANVDFGGPGGFITIQSGQGGAAIGNSGYSAESGGALTLNAGDAGSNNGNIDLGADGGNVYIGAGDSTGNGVNGGTIYLTSGAADASALAGDVVIQAGGTWTFDGAGNLSAPGNVSAVGNITADYFIGDGSQLTGITANTGNVTFSDQTVVGTGTQDGGSGLYLAPGTESVGNLQYLRVRGGDYITHIHLDTGNNSYFDQYFGDDNKYVKLANTGNIVINTNNLVDASAQWTFGTDGNLNLPGNLVIVGNTSVFGTDAALIAPTDDKPLIALSSGANGAATSLWIEDYANVGTSNIAAVYANPTPGSKIVRIAVGQNGSPGPNLWDFDAAGNLTVPGNIIMTTGIVGSGASPAPSLSGFSSVSAITVSASGNISATGNVTGGNVNTGMITLTNGATIKNTAGNAIAIGYLAGNTSQGSYATAIGFGAGGTSQGTDAIAIGGSAGSSSQGNYGVSIGYLAGQNTQGTQAVAIGLQTGGTSQGAGAVALGTYSGRTGQGNYGVSIGYLAGNTTQGNNSVAMGRSAGETTQGEQAVAIGLQAGFTAQGNYAVAIGKFSANSSQGEYAVAVGPNAGFENQLANAVAIGSSAGASSQGINSVAIGVGAAYNTQGNSAVAVGNSAGYLLQGINSVAIGDNAGFSFQGANAVAIGRLAGNTNQANNSIIINATGAVLDQPTANTFTVSPVRNDVANVAQVMFYNTTSKEITYGNIISVTGNVTGGNILGNGASMTGVATQVTGSWTVTTGTNNYSFTVPINNTYQLWVLGNIPNGIIVYNATVSVSNTNVPVIGQQFAWNYEGGGNILMFNSIPAQIIGTAGAISNAQPAVATTNVFTFGINNTSGNTVTVNYGYTKIS